MPYRSRKSAESRAKKIGFPKSNVTKGDGWYIAPRGYKTKAAKKAYAKKRAAGWSKERSAKYGWGAERKSGGD
jgi:hypothetical protein